MKGHYVIIRNHRAGSGGVRADRLDALMQVRSVSFERHETPHVDWDDVVARVRHMPDARIIVAGGDGTIRHVFEALWKRDALSVPVAFIPRGTGNVAAHALGVPFGLERAIDRALAGSIQDVDLGILNDRHLFFVGGGFGLLADNAILLDESLKRRFGLAAYFLNLPAVIVRDYREKEFDVVIDDGSGHAVTVRTHSLVVLNQLSLAGIRPFRDIRPDDGRLDLFTIQHSGFAGLVRAAFDFFTGTRASRCLSHRASPEFSCRLIGFRGRVQLDGDPIEGVGSELRFRILPKAGRVVC